MEMTREECERLILEKMQDIFKIMSEYNPETAYFSGCYLKRAKDEGVGDYLSIAFNNEYFNEGSVDEERLINYITSIDL